MRCLPSGDHPDFYGERIAFRYTFAQKYRVFAMFIICGAILTAAFAAGGIFRSTEFGARFFEKLKGEISRNEADVDEGAEMPPTIDQTTVDVPHDCNGTAIVSRDLSCSSRGEMFLLNETLYHPDVDGLLKKELTGLEIKENSVAPLVLIVHTHTTES